MANLEGCSREQALKILINGQEKIGWYYFMMGFWCIEWRWLEVDYMIWGYRDGLGHASCSSGIMCRNNWIIEIQRWWKGQRVTRSKSELE